MDVIGIFVFIVIAVVIGKAVFSVNDAPADQDVRTVWQFAETRPADAGPNGEFNGQVDVGGNCPDGLCMAHRNQHLTGSPGARWNDFLEAQEPEVWPEVRVVKEQHALPRPMLGLPEPEELPSVFDAYRDRQGAYRVKNQSAE